MQDNYFKVFPGLDKEGSVFPFDTSQAGSAVQAYDAACELLVYLQVNPNRCYPMHAIKFGESKLSIYRYHNAFPSVPVVGEEAA